MALISIELVTVLVTIVIILRYKLNKKFVLWLLKGNKIYLPPTENDCKMLEELKKGKSKQGDTIIRMCEVSEYISRVNDENMSESDIIVFFYLTSFANLLLIESEKVLKILMNFYYYNLEQEIISENDYYNVTLNATYGNFNNIDDTQNFHPQTQSALDSTISVGASFTFITVSYIIYMNFKIIFKHGYKSYEAKVFFLVLILSFLSILSLLYFFDNIFYFDANQICSVINQRLNSISEQAFHSENKVSVTHPNFNICNKNALKSFFAFIFSVFLALIYRSTMRLSTFDNILINANEQIVNVNKSKINSENLNISQNSSTFESLKNYSGTQKIKFLCKLKQIINTLLLLLLIDPLLKNYIVENKIISEISYNFFIISPLILTEFILNLICMKYYSALFLNQNYYEMIEFGKNFNSEIKNIQYIKQKMNYINTKFWEYFLQLFNLMFIGMIIFIFFINRSNVWGYFDYLENKENFNTPSSDFKFRKNFLETLLYFILLATTFAKAVFSNINTFYLKNFSLDSKTLFI